jgi:hypothetical protein
MSTPFFFGHKSTIYRAVWANGYENTAPRYVANAAQAQMTGHFGVLDVL